MLTFSQENALKMSHILPRPQYVKKGHRYKISDVKISTLYISTLMGQSLPDLMVNSLRPSDVYIT